MPPQFEISPEQREQLVNKGYILIPSGISAELLDRLRNLAQRLEQEAMEIHATGESPPRTCIIKDPVGHRVMRRDDIIEDDADAVLDLLASPGMMAVARELCGRGTVPMHTDILYKHSHPHPVILWHQGAQHSRKFTYLNVGVYLDDAPEGDGCLRYVPGTQRERQPITEMAQEHGWEIPGVVEQAAKAGDILVQDMMVLHGSQPKRIEGVRRTVYIELRPYEGILETAFQTPEWAELRRRWMGMVVRRAAPEDWPEDWKIDLPDDLADDATEVAAIIERHENPIPAYYSHVPVKREDYPVPADLR